MMEVVNRPQRRPEIARDCAARSNNPVLVVMISIIMVDTRRGEPHRISFERAKIAK
jgi:hypothetical protein